MDFSYGYKEPIIIADRFYKISKNSTCKANEWNRVDVSKGRAACIYHGASTAIHIKLENV